MGRIYDGHGPHGMDWAKTGEDMDGMFPSVWHHDANDDVEAAFALLRERGAFAENE